LIELDTRSLIDLNKANAEILKKLNNEKDNKELIEIIKELNKNVSKNYLFQHIPVVIILGIFQFIFIIFCLVLLKTR
jgi:hypothetical protein